jgi:predicted transcriptional regulator
MKELTKAEEQVMQYLWEMGGGYAKQVMEKYPEPKPAYNTVSTIIRILESKGFIRHQADGKRHRYFPVISKEDYRNFATEKMVEGYYDGSPSKLLSHFVKGGEMDTRELDDLLKLIEEAKKKNP